MEVSLSIPSDLVLLFFIPSSALTIEACVIADTTFYVPVTADVGALCVANGSLSLQQQAWCINTTTIYLPCSAAVHAPEPIHTSTDHWAMGHRLTLATR